MRIVRQLLLVAAVTAVASPVVAQVSISDNDCTISLGPTTVLIPKYGDDAVTTSDGTIVLTADFATQGCSCVEAGDTGFDNPDEVRLVTPAGDEVQPFTFNDIDGYAQFEYVVTAADLAAGRREFQVKIFDSCGGNDVLVDTAAFDVALKTVSVPKATAPSIITHPQNRFAMTGASATFSVVATGSPTLTYQWFRNGAPIPGANASTFTIAAVAQADNQAKFRVSVTNGAGSVVSNEATLTVGFKY